MKLQRPDPGIDAAKSGLHGKAGIFFNAGLLEKGEPRFDLQDLDPYLVFDSRESMLGTLEAETLDLDPATPSTLDVITATRAGVATFTEPDGTIATAPSDTVRVDYTQGEQLTPTVYQNIGYTDFANSYWIARGFTKVGTVDGPLGYTGYEFAENNSHSNPGVYINSDLSDGSFQTFGVWLKSSSPISIALAATGSNRTSTINITTEWQFFQCTDNFNSTSGPHIGGFLTITQGSGITLFAAMPQLEEGTTASSFVANTTGSPKFITGATYGPRVPMILVEPSATNLFRNSQDLTASPNNISKATITQESETFKGQPVFRLTDDTSSGEHRLTIVPDSVTASRTIVHFFVKADTCTKFCITYPTAGDAGAAWNLQSGSALGSTAGSAVAQTIEDAGDGWFKVSMTYDRPTATATGHNIQTLQDSATSAANRNYQGDGTLSFLMTMPQLEYGETQTSFIPTSGSAVTRAADDLVISGSSFTDFYNQSEGTIYVEAVPQDGVNAFPYYFEFSDGTTANRHHVYRNGTSGNTYSVNISGSTLFNTPIGSVTLDALNRISYSYKENDYLGSSNGATPVPETGAVPTGISQLLIGNSTASTPRLMTGRIKRLIYWPTHSDSL